MTKEQDVKGTYLIYLLIFLGLMSAFGPFVTDMYLPSLPSMAVEFGVPVSDIQGGITSSLLGLAFGQILFGPLSDRFGRKPILLFSLILFSIATVLDIYSMSNGWFNFFRFFQGVGGAGGIVLSRSIATDCYTGKELVKTMAVIGAINGIAPIAAPVIGGFISEAHGWHGVFWCLFGIGIMLVFMTIPFIESLKQSMRKKQPLIILYGNFTTLLKNKPFLNCIGVFALANVVLFAYISSAPFIVQSLFGFSETAFSFIFAINALAIVAGSAISVKFKTPMHSVLCGIVIVTVLSIGLLLNSLFFRAFSFYELAVWLILGGLGFIFPAITTMAMERGRQAIGAASALLGSSGFAAGGLVSPVCGQGNIILPTALVIISAAVLLLFAGIFLKRKVYI